MIKRSEEWEAGYAQAKWDGRVTIERLRGALMSLISAWKDPGPMGTLYEVRRAVSYAQSVHDDTHL